VGVGLILAGDCKASGRWKTLEILVDDEAGRFLSFFVLESCVATCNLLGFRFIDMGRLGVHL